MSETTNEKIERQKREMDPNDPLPEGSFFERQAAKERKAYPYPCLVLLLYLLMGFCLDLWHPGWMIFLTIPLYYIPKTANGLNWYACSPIVITIIYLLMGFLLDMWHPGWIIFLTIPLFYLPKGERNFSRLMCNPAMVTIIYLLMGFYLNLWHPGWLIFLAIPLFQAATRK